MESIAPLRIVRDSKGRRIIRRKAAGKAGYEVGLTLLLCAVLLLLAYLSAALPVY